MAMSDIQPMKTHHVIFDGFGVDPAHLGDETFIFNMLLEIPKLIEMKVMVGPNLVRDYDPGHDGITGFAIVNFSHISIHTFVRTKEIYVDIFSCKRFDNAKVTEYLHTTLAPERVETLEIKYPWEK